MTAQISDQFRYREKTYALAGISEGELFDISDLELQPTWSSSACWRGYQAEFAISKTRLVVQNLHVNLVRDVKTREREQGPIINGVTPTPKKKFDFFNNHYEGLDYHLEYTGGLLLAYGFIRELYVHMGFHSAWKYENVIELLFERGVLKSEFDRSEKMAEIRANLIANNDGDDARLVMPSDDEIEKLIQRAFDRRYGW